VFEGNGATLNASTNSNTVNYNGGPTTQVVKGTTYHNLTLSGSGSKTISGVTVNATLSMQGTAAASAPPTYGGSASLEYKGSAVQTTGPEFLTTMSAGVIIDNSNGVSLSGTKTLNGSLTLTLGNITTPTSSDTVKIGTTGSISGASSSSYIDGKLARVYSGTGSKTFPIGKGSNTYRPLSVNFSALTGNITVTAEQFETALSGTLPADITLFPNRYWTVARTGSSSFTYDITLDGTGFSPAGTPRILKSDGSIVDLAATVSAPNYTTTGLTSMSDFALGSKCTTPGATATGGTLTCTTTSVTLSASTTAGTSFSWAGPGIVSGNTTGNPLVSSSGTYTVTVTNSAGGCTSTATALVNSNITLPGASALGGT
jgi:hypothetical protein